MEMVGWHDPLKHQSNVEGERVTYWMSQGAKPSPTAWNLMVSSGVVEGAKISKHKKTENQSAQGKFVAGEEPITKTQEAAAPVSETKEVHMETPEAEGKKAVRAQKNEAPAEA